MLSHDITIEDKNLFDEYLNAFEYKTSGLSFTSLFMYKDLNHFKYDIINDYLCISGHSHLEVDNPDPFLFPPLTKTGYYDIDRLSDTIDQLRQIFEKKGYIFSIRLLPFHMADIFEQAKPERFNFGSDRPNYDYVYLSKDLIELKGKKFHRKKNHLNYFKSHYDYQYMPLSANMAEACLALNSKINEKKKISQNELKLLRMEEHAMKEAFLNYEKAGFIGGVISINENIEAFTMGGPLGKKSIVVHIEKANTNYRGLYQAINNEFCKHAAQSVKYINREEDMGLPGLRKAKRSYRPAMYVEKYIAMFKEDV